MPEYTSTVADFTLVSTWACAPLASGGWTISSTPTVASATKAFDITLPGDAVISRMWVTANLGSPLSGAEYVRLGETNFSTGEADVTGITAESTTFSAPFSFKANGAVFSDAKTHSGSLSFGTPTLHISYTTTEDGDAPGTDTPSGTVTGGDRPGRLPRLLDANMREVTRLHPLHVSLDLTLKPLSTAVITIPWGQTEVKVLDFVEVFSPDGSAGVFRVSEVENAYGEQQKIYCEEALTTLSDSIAVGVQAMSGTFREVIAAILGAQSIKRWVLGDVDLPDDYETVYSYSYDNLYDAITDLTDMLPEGYAWERDTSVYPFVMSLRALGDEDQCEARLTRNLEAVRVSIDTSKLCTRVYPFGAGEGTDRINLSTLSDVNALYLDADTVGTWGVVTRSFVDEDIGDSLTLKNVAEQYLERYKDPVVSISLDALALYAATGESLDRFRLGRLCRLPLGAYNTIMDERVVAVSYSDVYGRPQKATVTLANRVSTVSDELGSMLREATHSKLIGGKVKDTDYTASYDDLTSDPEDWLACTVEVTGYGNVLSAKAVYSLSPEGKAVVYVDGEQYPQAVKPGEKVDILPYLTKDDSGVPVTGKHTVTIAPTGDDWYFGSVTVTVKTIDKE